MTLWIRDETGQLINLSEVRSIFILDRGEGSESEFGLPRWALFANGFGHSLRNYETRLEAEAALQKLAQWLAEKGALHAL